ncbi:MAG: membrane dipeptidase [Anaerolineae bacterium]|nr:membrane dipeptidase [Anaerolineae bacterium]
MPRITRRAFLRRAAALAGAPCLAALGPPWPWQKQADAPFVAVDAHEDLAWIMLEYGRDYTRSAQATRDHERASKSDIPWHVGSATLGLPDWIEGRVAVVGATLFVMKAAYAEEGSEIIYTDADEAYRWGMAELDCYEAFAQANPQVRLIDTAADLDAVLATWADDAAPEDRQVGLLRCMEGADLIREPAECGAWFERGVRSVGLAWKMTRYAGGTGEPGPLTELGRALLDEMAALGMMLDISHIAEEAFYQALDHFGGVVFASHANPRAFCDWDRCLSDAMVKRLVERGGVIGVVLYNGYLKPGWTPNQDSRNEVSVADAADVIDYICQLAGDCSHVGIGSDFDGGLGWEHIPHEMNSIADVMLIADALRARGYSEADVKAVMGGNFLRLYREGLPA